MSTGMLPRQIDRPRGAQPPSRVAPESSATAWKNVGDDERLLSMLAGGALAGVGAAKRGWLGLGLAAMGAGLLYRAASGHCYTYQALGVSTASQRPGVRPKHGVRVTKSIHIERSPEKVSRQWGRLDELPKIMRHLERVEMLDDNRSRWVAKALGMNFEWDAETTTFVEGHEIRWRSLPGGDVDSEGAVMFEPDPPGSTILRVKMRYDPPGGVVGDRLARWIGGDLESQIDEDLRRFKAVMEAGEAPTTKGQPRCS